MTRKLKENTNPNSEEVGLSTSRTWMDFLDASTLAAYPGRKEWRERLMHSLLQWAEKPTSLEIKRFCIDFKIPYTTLIEWIEKYKDIAEVYSFAKIMIACHRQIGAMRKELDGNYAYKDMHLYDEDWHEINIYHSDLKKEEEKQSHTFIINSEKPKVLSKEELKLMKEIVKREEE